MRLICWDIDGTLLRAGPVARRVFDEAITSVIGHEPGEHGVVMSGKTDPQIALEILDGLAVERAEAEQQVPAILEHLEAALLAGAAQIRAHGHLMPGVEALLADLGGRDGVAQTVLTGNIAANAAVKLRAFGLDRWLDLGIGAYGSDHADRSRLVPLAVARAAEARGRRPDPVWVVGDTPNDLACARAGGARCLLVATGRVPLDELAGLGADAVLPDLGDTDHVRDVLLS